MTDISVSAQERLRAFSKDKRDLLRLIREEESRQKRKVSRYSRDDGIRPLTSLAQQRLWFIDQLEGGSPGYTVLVAVRLRGALNQESLQKALDTIVQRHEVLRTVFVNVNGEPTQEIASEGRFALRMIDLSGYEGDREAQVRLNKMEEAHGKFDLGRGPLIRGRLLRMQVEEHVLLITLHHIIADGWSKGVLIREFARLYKAYREGRSNPLEPLPIQYADYAQWQRNQWLQGERLNKQLNYWRARLEGVAPQLELPTDRPRPAAQSYRGENVAVVLDAQLSAKLKVFAQQHEMTLFMVLYAGWTILLSRLSGQEDVVIGTPFANRQRPELEGLIGLFVNALALRVRVRSDLPLEELLEQVKEMALGAYDHQDVPFEKVIEAVQPQRSLSRSPLFQVMFVLHNWPNGELRLPALTVTIEDEVDEPSILDLWVALEERGDEIVGSVTYATDLFNRETIERWMACFTILLRGMTDAVHSRIDDLPMLSENERRQIIESFNATRVAYPHEKVIHELFEMQVERAPNAVALVYENQILTYAEVNCRANQLGRYLKDRGIGPDRLVALCVERSIEVVVGLLGILKSGGTCVPLDPSYPTERLRYMLEDAAPQILLTQERLRCTLPPVSGEVIALDSSWSAIAENRESNLDARTLQLTSRHLAYVIYTSGSTGKPKGVAAEHRGMVNRIAAQATIGAFSGDDICCHKTSIGFVDAIFEILGPLSYGRPLVLVSSATIKDVQEFASLIEREHITRLVTVPSLAQSLLESMRSTQSLQGLRSWTLSGEEVKSELLRKLQERLPKCTFTNLYGSSEVAADVTCYLSANSEDFRVPIGRPIPNTQIYILDRHLQPVPIGAAGEIYIGGAGVARGYLNRPELTAERFIADRFGHDPEARLYSSRDLGRWRADGTLEYLGRSDSQVKIRGFRIELGEIEAQLARHEQVKETAIVAREDVPGEKRLVAYITRRDQRGPSVVDFRAHLKTMLPEYMVPNAFVILESLPLTPSGKLNRRALPVPDIGAYVTRRYEAPQGEMEEILAGIWQDLLRVKVVGRQDNFFELGGHSLLIVQMMERLRRVGLSAEVRRVFESPTLADLASALTKEAVGQFEVPPNRIPPECKVITPLMLPLVELKPEEIQRIVRSVPGGAANIQDIYPLAPLQEGLLFHHLLDQEGGDTYVLPMLLSLSSRERLKELIAALQSVIDCHDVLRTAVLWEQLPQPVQVVYRRVTLPVEEFALDGHRDSTEQLDEWIKPERQKLDLRQAPLMRLQIAADPHSERSYVLLQMHHIVGDNTSLEIVISEIVAHLEGRAEELPQPLPYRNHVAQALAYTRTHDPEAFFRSKLGDIDEPTAPFELLDVRGDVSRIDEARQEFEPALAQRVRVQARRLSVSVATVFHAAWALVVAATSGRDDVVFGSVLLGRVQGSAGAQRILGMFINTLPLRLRLQNVTATGLVEQTQRELVELLSHEQASLALAQRCSGIVRPAPLFSAVLNFRHSEIDREPEWTGAAGIRVLSRQHRTNYPITLSVDDLGEGFALTAQTDRRIDPHRVTGYLHTAMLSLVKTLEQAPQTPARILSILPEFERHQLITLFNAMQTPYPQEKLIHELFEDQVQRTPNAIAIVYEEQRMTYAELNHRANALARYLRNQGVSPDDMVGICVERGLEMPLGLLGILKAGAAYVPLDPKYPAERLRYMLRDAAPKALLTQERLRERLPDTPAQVITLDDDWSEIAQQPPGNLDARTLGLHSHQLAYVIYTSGSTGQPKGVAIEHRNTVNLICWGRSAMAQELFGQTLQSTSLSFDLSVYECFVPLAAGGCIRVVENALAVVKESAGVTLINTVPSAIKGVLDSGSVPETTLVVNLAGEVLKEELVNRIFSESSVERVCNLYGPSETTTYSTCVWMTREGGFSASVGRPIANTQIYLLNRWHQVVPMGVLGEVYIGGAGVARGYLNRPELTAERFIVDPFSTDPQARLYKTGDLGRWRPDGTIEYLGRNDHQVKIRGYRIELGEIEALLERHEQVKEAVALAREDVQGEKRLVAYVTQHDERGLSIESLRAHLRSMLPEYVVPSAFVILENWPLTPSGKLDRGALPVPEIGAYVSGHYEPPEGKVELILAGIWQELLQVQRVGRRHNFFDLGGHSLLAMRVVSRIRQQLRVDVPLRVLFDAPTVEQLSVQVKAEGNRQAAQEALRMGNLARDLRQEINEMHDDAVLERIAELEKRLGYTESQELARSCADQ